MKKHETFINLNSFDNRVRRGRRRVLAVLAAVACIMGMVQACGTHDTDQVPQAAVTKDTDADTYRLWRENMTRYQVAEMFR